MLAVVILWLVQAIEAQSEAPLCKLLGSPESPFLSKEGDVTIGGAFSIHSKITQPLLSFRDTPPRLQCSRYCIISLFEWQNYCNKMNLCLM